MKKLLLTLVLVTALLIGIIAPAAGVQAAGPCPNLPAGPVTAYWDTSHWVDSYFYITLSGAGSFNGKYLGWCVDIHGAPEMFVNHAAILKCTYDPSAAIYVDKPQNLDLVNWIFNQEFPGKDAGGGLGTYVWADVQIALWRLLENTTPGFTGGIFPEIGWTEAKIAQIIALATASGEGFVPVEGELVGVFVIPVDASGNPVHQISMITVEVPPPPPDEGCTPGYWKSNADNFDAVSWIGYEPTDDFNTVFGIPEQTLRANGRALYTNPTLREALDANGSGINLLARAAVAALLNAANPNINYAIDTPEDVIAMVQDAVADGADAIKDLGVLLDSYNNYGCSINQQGEPLEVLLTAA